MFQPLQAEQHVVLEDEDALIFIFLFNFERHILFSITVIGLINETKGTLTKFLLDVKSIRDLEGLLRGHHGLLHL
jgi:hypothetical protein